MPYQPGLVVITGMYLFHHFKILKLLSKPINLIAHFLHKCDLGQYVVINKVNFGPSCMGMLVGASLDTPKSCRFNPLFISHINVS